MKKVHRQRVVIIGCMLVTGLLFGGCATQQGYQGAGVGAVTGATAGMLLDPHNRWRGAVIGGGLSATLGGALTNRQAYRQPYSENYFSPHRQNYQPQNYTAQGAFVGGATGAAAGALLDHDNRWRGSLIGGALGGLFGGSIGSINSGPGIPVLNP